MYERTLGPKEGARVLAWVGMDKKAVRVRVRVNDTGCVQLGLEGVIKPHSCLLGLPLSYAVLGPF